MADKNSSSKTTKYMCSFKGEPQNFLSLSARFKETYQSQPAGFKILGMWHGPNGVFALVETDDWAPVYAYLAKWSDLATFDAVPVLDSKEAAEAFEY